MNTEWDSCNGTATNDQATSPAASYNMCYRSLGGVENIMLAGASL